ncbi:hypothetical protein DFJ73DRAFT_849456 [Zopfochytrium polystomum]|nr:hypothetical protein DFJ73DRAFT_849456 [Zopfochytrium polystomum]
MATSCLWAVLGGKFRRRCCWCVWVVGPGTTSAFFFCVCWCWCLRFLPPRPPFCSMLCVYAADRPLYAPPFSFVSCSTPRTPGWLHRNG